MNGFDGPKARLPYTAPSTPTSVKNLLLDTHGRMLLEDDEAYPESPTRKRPSPSPTRSLSPKRNGWAKRRPRRFSRSLKRGSICLLGLAFLFMLIRLHDSPDTDTRRVFSRLSARWREDRYDDVCRFVSPVEAYKRDLERLNRLYPHHIGLESMPDLARMPSLENLSNSTFGTHFFSPSGHLVINSTSDIHPIPLLVALGEKKWEDLLASQSRTLEEAVAEYKRRYKRNPPKGFDLWWDFALTHNLVLPDEYDRINLDLAPFLALPKSEMRRRMEMVREMAETFTVHVKDGTVGVEILDEGGLKWDGTLPRSRDVASLIEVFARFLPDLKATFSIFDQPQIYLSWARRESLVQMGLQGDHTVLLQETDAAQVRLARSCHPDSPFRKNASQYEGHSFIYDNLKASDLCQNPYVVPIHGLTIEPHTYESHPRPHTMLLPLFSLAKTSINADILITPLDQFNDPTGHDPLWEDKTKLELAWRGSSTGISMMSQGLDWRQSHRIRLHKFANSPKDGMKGYIAPDIGQDPDRPLPAGQTYLGAQRVEQNAKEMADYYFDMKLAGSPLQCKEEDGTCKQMAREIEFAPHQSAAELNKHKYLLDIDGNGWSGRFRRLMSTNSMVIKASLFTEWYQPHLIPWFMYAPTKLDFSDLTDILAFFRGTPEHPEIAFDETAKALGRNGQCFAKRMFRLQDLQAYMMRLFLEYARLVADDGVDMDFRLMEFDEEEPVPIGEENMVEPESAEQIKEERLNGPIDEIWIEPETEVEMMVGNPDDEYMSGVDMPNDYDEQMPWSVPDDMDEQEGEWEQVAWTDIEEETPWEDDEDEPRGHAAGEI